MVELDFTPNPDTLKYSVLGKILVERGVYSFNDVESAFEKSPLAERILELGGIAQVMVARNYVTVTRQSNVDWDDLHSKVMPTVEAFVAGEELAYVGELAEILSPESLTEDGKKIAAVLEEIRPFVAKDGGDIQFQKYEDGIVYLTLHGSCQGCPSSILTLKEGVEKKLKEILPEIKEVVSV